MHDSYYSVYSFSQLWEWYWNKNKLFTFWLITTNPLSFPLQTWFYLQKKYYKISSGVIIGKLIWYITTKTYLLFKFNNFLHSIVSKLPFRGNKLFSLISTFVEETWVDLTANGNHYIVALIRMWNNIRISKLASESFTNLFSYSIDTLQVSIYASLTFFFMSGCLAPWSITRPRTSLNKKQD